MKKQLSLPVAAISKIAPKHKAHGTPIAQLVSAAVIDSLGVDLGRSPKERKLAGIEA